MYKVADRGAWGWGGQTVLSRGAQKKSEAVGRRLGAGPGVFLRGSGDLSTPHLGFCRGSKGTREEPSGLSSRLRSDFLNSAGGAGQETGSAIAVRITSCRAWRPVSESSPAVLLLVRPKVTFLESEGGARLDCREGKERGVVTRLADRPTNQLAATEGSGKMNCSVPIIDAADLFRILL